MKRVAIGFLASFSIIALAQNEPLFTSQCIAKNVVGFEWDKNWWSHSAFKPGKIFMAKKVDHSERAFKGKDIFETPISCENISDFVLELGISENNDKIRNACYTIKEHGSTESLFSSAEKCTERYDKSGKLKEVHCKYMRFSPDGLFIRLPWDEAMNLNPYPKNGQKDSLTISVGTCARIN